MYIFLARNNVQAGPYSLEQVNQMLSDGQVALTDLMWHEGMANWQSVGEMTGGQYHYTPAFSISSTPDQTTPNAETEDDYIINNRPEDFEKEQPKVDNSSVWDRYNANNPHKEKPDTIKIPLTKLGKSPQSMDISHAKKQLDLASIGSRMIAKIVDLFLLFLPTIILFASVGNSPEFEKILKLAESSQSPMQYSQQMNDLLSSAIPQHLLLITNLLFWGIIIIQGFLLAWRGQTLGKMLMRIRVLDIQSNAIPTVTHSILLRTGVFVVIMLLIALGLVPLALVLIGIDFVMMMSNADRQSLHDKIAKTYVVRADDTQTTPLELTPDA